MNPSCSRRCQYLHFSSQVVCIIIIPPIIENIKDTVLVGSPDSLVIILHGISDGDPDKDQSLDVSANMSNYQVINNFDLRIYPGTDSARLVMYFNNGISGENITTVILTENDPENINQFMTVAKMSFSTWVINYINKAPYFNELDTAYIQLDKGTTSNNAYRSCGWK